MVRILIVGGGYVGVYAALELERRLAVGEAEITLISPENYMRYQPLLPEVASGSVEPRHVVIALRRILRRTRVVQGELIALDHDRQTARVELGDGTRREIIYDHVVLGLGSVTKALSVPGLVEHAVGFQTLTEAIHLRNQILSRLEAAESTDEPDRRRRALTFVFVGGGYAGVEALAELEDLACDAIADYPSLSPDDLRWVLVEATDHILPAMQRRMADLAAATLRRRRVEIRLRTQVQWVRDGTLHLDDGDQLAADTLVWMPGIAPHPLARDLGLPCDDQHRLIADQYLRVRGVHGAWTAGDCAAVPDRAGGWQPPTAQHAEREARRLAQNLIATLRDRRLVPFRYRARGEFVTLGNRKAVARVLAIQLHGLPAWMLRRGYYLARFPSTERRLRLAVDWVIGVPFPRDITQLGSEQHPDQPFDRAAKRSDGPR